MPVETALKIFRNPYNCAESVFRALDPENKTGNEIDLSTCGGGRAPEGICGALFGAKQVVPFDRHNELEQAFTEKTGSIKCKEIKKLKISTCGNCVKSGTSLALSLT